MPSRKKEIETVSKKLSVDVDEGTLYAFAENYCTYKSLSRAYRFANPDSTLKIGSQISHAKKYLADPRTKDYMDQVYYERREAAKADFSSHVHKIRQYQEEAEMRKDFDGALKCEIHIGKLYGFTSEKVVHMHAHMSLGNTVEEVDSKIVAILEKDPSLAKKLGKLGKEGALSDEEEADIVEVIDPESLESTVRMLPDQ
jgi:hypothetical protein